MTEGAPIKPVEIAQPVGRPPLNIPNTRQVLLLGNPANRKNPDDPIPLYQGAVSDSPKGMNVREVLGLDRKKKYSQIPEVTNHKIVCKAADGRYYRISPRGMLTEISADGRNSHEIGQLDLQGRHNVFLPTGKRLQLSVRPSLPGGGIDPSPILFPMSNLIGVIAYDDEQTAPPIPQGQRHLYPTPLILLGESHGIDYHVRGNELGYTRNGSFTQPEYHGQTKQGKEIFRPAFTVNRPVPDTAEYHLESRNTFYDPATDRNLIPIEVRGRGKKRIEGYRLLNNKTPTDIVNILLSNNRVFDPTSDHENTPPQYRKRREYGALFRTRDQQGNTAIVSIDSTGQVTVKRANGNRENLGDLSLADDQGTVRQVILQNGRAVQLSVHRQSNQPPTVIDFSDISDLVITDRTSPASDYAPYPATSRILDEFENQRPLVDPEYNVIRKQFQQLLGILPHRTEPIDPLIDPNQARIRTVEEMRLRSEIFEHAGERPFAEALQLVQFAKAMYEEEMRFGDKGMLADIEQMVADEQRKNEVIHDRHVLFIPAGNKKLLLIGDTHGDTEIIDKVLYDANYFNDPDIIVVFNGDLEDRGPNSLGVWEIALKLKMKDPKRVHILRGDHEVGVGKNENGFADWMRINGNLDLMQKAFHTELIRKYGQQQGELLFSEYESIDETNLPSELVTGNGFLITHASIPPDLQALDEVSALTGDEVDRVLKKGVHFGDPLPDVAFSPRLPHEPPNIKYHEYRDNFIREAEAVLSSYSHYSDTQLDFAIEIQDHDVNMLQLKKAVEKVRAHPTYLYHRDRAEYRPSLDNNLYAFFNAVNQNLTAFNRDLLSQYMRKIKARRYVRSHQEKSEAIYDGMGATIHTTGNASTMSYYRESLRGSFYGLFDLSRDAAEQPPSEFMHQLAAA